MMEFLFVDLHSVYLKTWPSLPHPTLLTLGFHYFCSNDNRCFSFKIQGLGCFYRASVQGSSLFSSGNTNSFSHMHHKVDLSYSYQMCAIFIQVTFYLMVLLTTLLLLGCSVHHSKPIKFVLMLTFGIFILTEIIFALKLAVQHMQTQDPH